MAVFNDKKIVEELFGELWTKMLTGTEFGNELKKNGISVVYIINNPDVVMYVDGDGPIFGEEAQKKAPMLTMKLSGDHVHKFWLKKLNIPKALALRHIRAKGPVGKILQFLPMLKPGQAMYPGYCEKYNLPLD